MQTPRFTETDTLIDLILAEETLRSKNIDLDRALFQLHRKEEPYIRDGDPAPAMSREDLIALLLRNVQ